MRSQPGKRTFATLREKCPYSEFFYSVFSPIRTEYGEIISPYSVQMGENIEQKNSEHGHLSRSTIHILPSTSRSKGNQTLKFGQLIKCNTRNIFLEESFTKCDEETFSRPSSKK